MSKLDIESLRPADTPEYMTPAWLSCMRFAISTPEIVESFRAETGMQWRPGRSGIEVAIDAATGADEAFIRAFIEWANIVVWGSMDGPQREEREP